MTTEWCNDGSTEIEFQELNPEKNGSQGHGATRRTNLPARSQGPRTVEPVVRTSQNDYRKGFLKTGKIPHQDPPQRPLALFTSLLQGAALSVRAYARVCR